MGSEAAIRLLDPQVRSQELPQRILTNLILRGRVPHTLLFYGPDGVGKRTLALSLSAALNCEAGAVPACGQCHNCRMSLQGSHPDVHVTGGESRVLIAEVRELIREMSLKPHTGKWKVLIIENADQIREESANALLKLLEEPPGSTCVILTAETRERLLPTVLSRAMAIRFSALPRDTIEDILVEKFGVSREKARETARLSRGSLSVARNDLSSREGDADSELVSRLDRLSRLTIPEVLDVASELSQKTRQEWARQWTLRAETALVEDLTGSPIEQAFGHAMEIALLWDARRMLMANCNPRLVYEVLLLKLSESTGVQHRGEIHE